MRIRRDTLTLTLRGHGELAVWLGPAVRGLLAERFRDRLCIYSRQERQTTWQRCSGCAEMVHCAYGRMYEPDVPADRTPWNNQQNAARPLVVAPEFPLPEEAEPGMVIPVTVTTVGPLDAEVELLLNTLTTATATLGEGRIPFDVARPAGATETFELLPEHLPAAPDRLPGILPCVGVVLTAPLFMTAQREPVLGVPNFGDLLRTAIGTLSHLFHLYDQPLEVDHRALVDAARQVELIDHCIGRFGQRRASRRSGKFDLEGISGHARWGNVPLSLLPWLLWGGRVHVGENRVAGAGSWRVVLE